MGSYMSSSRSMDGCNFVAGMPSRLSAPMRVVARWTNRACGLSSARLGLLAASSSVPDGSGAPTAGIVTAGLSFFWTRIDSSVSVTGDSMKSVDPTWSGAGDPCAADLNCATRSMFRATRSCRADMRTKTCECMLSLRVRQYTWPNLCHLERPAQKGILLLPHLPRVAATRCRVKRHGIVKQSFKSFFVTRSDAAPVHDARRAAIKSFKSLVLLYGRDQFTTMLWRIIRTNRTFG